MDSEVNSRVLLGRTLGWGSRARDQPLCYTSPRTSNSMIEHEVTTDKRWTYVSLMWRDSDWLLLYRCICLSSTFEFSRLGFLMARSTPLLPSTIPRILTLASSRTTCSDQIPSPSK